MIVAVRQLFREPWVINAVQFASYLLTGIAGMLAVLGALPAIVTAQIGIVLSVFVGSILFIGCVAGCIAVLHGLWFLERLALLWLDLGWALMLIASLFYAFKDAQSPTIWLIIALEIMVIGDNIKRYRRIDWAYLDPAK